MLFYTIIAFVIALMLIAYAILYAIRKDVLNKVKVVLASIIPALLFIVLGIASFFIKEEYNYIYIISLIVIAIISLLIFKFMLNDKKIKKGKKV